MTNREKYQRTFSKLHASEMPDFKAETTEVTKMEITKGTRKHISRFTAVCAAAVLAAGLCTTAYAADVGGIRTSIKLWLSGEQRDAVMEVEQHEDMTNYTVTYEDENGEQREIQGGGVAYDMWGNEIPLTEQDIIDQFDDPEVRFNEDGTVIVYYKDQKIDVTDKFDKDGVCYTQVERGDGETFYMTIQKDGGCGISMDSFPDPD